MKFTIRQRFDLHVCFEDPNGDQVVNFDLYHRWNLPDCRKGVLCGDDSVMRCEGRYFRELSDDGDIEGVGFQLHYARASNVVRFGKGRKAYRFRHNGTSSGGNMHWEIIRFPMRQIPHVLNWLRRQRLFFKSEWLEDFSPIWDSPRAITETRLREFGVAHIRHCLKHKAKHLHCSVEELIRLSRP